MSDSYRYPCDDDDEHGGNDAPATSSWVSLPFKFLVRIFSLFVRLSESRLRTGGTFADIRAVRVSVRAHFECLATLVAESRAVSIGVSLRAFVRHRSNIMGYVATPSVIDLASTSVWRLQHPRSECRLTLSE